MYLVIDLAKKIYERQIHDMKQTDLREYVAAIQLDGENGEPNERDYKKIWAQNIENASLLAGEWAAERREATGDPWHFHHFADNHNAPNAANDLPSSCDFAAGAEECRHNTEKNILDTDLTAARDTLPGMKLQQLCRQAIEIMNTGTINCPDGEQIKMYLIDLNLEITKRVAFWALITLALSLFAAFGGGMLTLHVAGGAIAKTLLNSLQGAYAAAVTAAALGIANKKLIALENWAATWAANSAARQRAALEKNVCDDGRVEILGDNLRNAMGSLGLKTAELTYAVGGYEVWELSREEYNKLAAVPDDEWEAAFEYSWWRWGRSAYEGTALYNYTVNERSMLGYLDEGRLAVMNAYIDSANDCCDGAEEHIDESYFTDSCYSSFTNWASEVMGHSTERNITSLAVSLAKENGLTLAEFMQRYQP